MPEKKIVIDGLELSYEGLFDLNDLLKAIDKYARERGYAKREKRRQEIVRPGGKEFSMELRPTKIKTEYYALMIKIRINITNLQEVEVLKNKVKTKLNKGNVSMVFDAWALTDFRRRWEQKPLYYFLRTLVDKFIYKFYSDKFHGELIEDCHFLHTNIKAYLNLHRY
jgi:hypothetical protein